MFWVKDFFTKPKAENHRRIYLYSKTITFVNNHSRGCMNKASKMQQKPFGLHLLYFGKALGKNPEETTTHRPK